MFYGLLTNSKKSGGQFKKMFSGFFSGWKIIPHRPYFSQ
jgi:hypothetical protein